MSGEDVHSLLRERMCAHVGVRHARVVSTGRAGLTLLLRALRRLESDKDEVIVPSYTCYSVAASVVKAGCRVRVVDVVPDTLDYVHEQMEEVDTTRVLAVLATNLYGLPNDLPRLRRFADATGLFLIDDAAQAMDAEVGGRRSGTWGHAGLFSFDKGKNVSAIDGGVVVTDDESVDEALASETASLEPPPLARSAVDVVKALVYFVLLRPRLYWIPNSIPQLELGSTRFDTTFPLEQASRPLAALAATTSTRIEALTAGRCRAARLLEDGLKGVSGVRTITPLSASRPVYLRFPVLFDSAAARDEALRRITESGGGASASYPRALVDVPELRDHLVTDTPSATGGRHVASRILTLPTHAFAHAADRQRILDIVIDVARRASHATGTSEPNAGAAVCAG